jgi:hypothetical protein
VTAALLLGAIQLPPPGKARPGAGGNHAQTGNHTDRTYVLFQGFPGQSDFSVFNCHRNFSERNFSKIFHFSKLRFLPEFSDMVDPPRVKNISQCFLRKNFLKVKFSVSTPPQKFLNDFSQKFSSFSNSDFQPIFHIFKR